MQRIQTNQGLIRSVVISLIAAFIVVTPVQQSTASAPAISATTYYDGTCNLGDGNPSNHLTSATAFEITNADQLWEVTDCLDPSAPVYFKLSNDIDVSGAQYAPTASPIGKSSTAVYSFSGVIEGQNHQVSGISMSSSTRGVGLFALLENAQASDLTVSGQVTTTKAWSSGQDASGLFGSEARGEFSAHNVSLRGQVLAVEVSGGLLGEAENLSLSQIVNYATISAVTNGWSGGVVGWVKESITASNTINHGTVSGEDSTGGVFGAIDGNAAVSGIENHGSVTGEDDVGGLVGYFGGLNGSITNSINEGNVSATNPDFGGLVGYATGSLVIEAATNSGVVEGSDFYGGGIVGRMDGRGSLRLEFVANVGTIQNSVGYIGGLVGYNNRNLLIQDSVNNGLVQSTDTSTSRYSVGGLIGFSDPAGWAEIERSSNYGSIVTPSNFLNVGGVIGAGRSVTFSEVTNHGDVEGGKKVGGIGGSLTFATLLETQNLGEISGSSEVGGLIGLLNGDSVIGSSKNSGDVYGASSVSGFVGAFNQQGLDISDSTNSGDITALVSAGGFVGLAVQYVTLTNVSNTGEIFADVEVGGFIGAGLTELIVRDSANSGAISGSLDVGGVAGYIGPIADFLRTTNRGSVGAADAAHVGGIAGTVDGNLGAEGVNNFGEIVGGSAIGGLFGQVTDGAYVVSGRNEGSVSGSEKVGGLLGYVSGSSEISASSNTGPITANTYSGGLVGFMDYTNYLDVINSQNSGDITALDRYAGGIVGASGANYTYFGTVLNTGQVSASSGTAGGLVGEAQEVIAGTVANQGSVFSTGGEVGGLVGAAATFDLETGYNSGDVTGDDAVGGIIGTFISNQGNDFVETYQSGQVTANSNGDGLVGWSGSSTINLTHVYTTVASEFSETVTLDYLRQASNLQLGDFQTIWGYGLCTFNQGLPIFRYFNQVGTYYEDSCFTPPAPSETVNQAPAQYLGPTIRAILNQAQVGEQVVIQGSRLDSVTAVEIAGVSQEVIQAESNSLTLRINEETRPGVHDLVLLSSYGLLTVQQAIRVVESVTSGAPVTEAQTSELTGKTKLLPRSNSLAQAWMSENLPDSGVKRLVCTVTVTSAATTTQRIEARKLAKQTCDQAAEFLDSPSIWFQTKSTNTRFVGRTFLTFKG